MHNSEASQPISLRCTDQTLQGAVIVPGSKSITNRALLIAALSQGETTITGALISDDTQYMAEALRQMGVIISPLNAEEIRVQSTGKLTVPTQKLFIGNAGTAARFLTAACCLVAGYVEIDGNEDMRKRPIQPLIDALQSVGYRCRSETGSLPVVIDNNGLEAIQQRVAIDGGMSSQYISALMMIAPLLPAGLIVEVDNWEALDAKGYIELTLQIMRDFGAEYQSITSVECNGWQISANSYQRSLYAVEPDYSGCTYFWAANMLSREEVVISNLTKLEDSLQPDVQSLYVMQKFPNIPLEVDGSQIQDSIPTLAVLAAFNQGTVRFTGIKNLRVKECDRIEAMFTGLNLIKQGLAEIEGDDLIVHGDPLLQAEHSSTSIPTYNDHRIAMSFALAAIKLVGIIIENPSCVNKTFPSYWENMALLGMEITEAV